MSPENAYLEELFRGIPDRTILQELGRRGRICVMEATEAYFTEMREDGCYMDAVSQSILAKLARGIAREVSYSEEGDDRITRRSGSILVVPVEKNHDD